MADVQSAVRARLAAVSGVTDLTGTKRIFPDFIPQNSTTFPCITTHVISLEPFKAHLTGLSGIARARVQVTCYAQTRLGCTALEEQCRLALASWQGTAVSVVVRDVQPAGGGLQSIESRKDGTNRPMYKQMRDYFVIYQEATS